MPYSSFSDVRTTGVFRQHPGFGVGALPPDEQARRSSIPGVVTVASSSFGHQASFPMPSAWSPFGQQQQPYSGIHPAMPYPPGPPGYQPRPPYHYVPSSSSTQASYSSPARAPPRPLQPSEPSPRPLQPRDPPASAGHSQPGSGEAPSSFPPAYSISLSVDAAPGIVPIATRADAVMAWHPPPFATPVFSEGGGRKRARTLPEEGYEKAIEHEEDRKMAAASTGTTKKSTATQTPPYDTGAVESALEGAGAEAILPTTIATQTPPHLWNHPRQQQPTMMPYHASQQPAQAQGSVYFEQHDQRYAHFEEPVYHSQQPIARSYSEPLPQSESGQSLQVKESDPSGQSMIDRNKPPFSARKIPRRISRRGRAAIEPLPVIPVHPPPQPQPVSRRNSLAGHHSAAGTEGSDWFPGQLLLESSDEEIEHPKTRRV